MAWFLTRRDFARLLAASTALPAVAAAAPEAAAPAGDAAHAYPAAAYTPFGYLNNPYHCWDLHRSGILRSVPAIGFGFYFPAGPGGYFDYGRQAVYQGLLRLGLRIGDRLYFDSEDFGAGQLTAPHHSQDLFRYAFAAAGLEVSAEFLLAGEDTLAARVRVANPQPAPSRCELVAIAELRHGAEDWWGRDGLAAAWEPDSGDADRLLLRSFAAGVVFALGADRRSESHWLGADAAAARAWAANGSPDEAGQRTSYYPAPILGGLRFPLTTPAGGAAEVWVRLSRGVNRAAVLKTWRRAGDLAPAERRAKLHGDDAFWTGAPRLEGDWPDHWRRGWVYDFETLRMMVRRPIGAYRHPWDAMQIQAPRNVLAETSLDMWALAYGDPAAAQSVLLGQFQDAVQPNVPCMRESAVMNMVAADGSECGTSIAWCYPFFCIASTYARTGDRQWLAALYPHLAAFVHWTLRYRADAAGFIVGKCSWETGMDASARFQIAQPTGGEDISFIRVVELQAAMAQAAALLARWAGEVGRGADQPLWHSLSRAYAARTQQLWNGRDWFQDYDTRAGRSIVPPSDAREIGQCAPIFCGIARPEQIAAMRPLLRWYRTHPRYYLEWSSLVLPYLESLWWAGEDELRADVTWDLGERVYRSTDRRDPSSPAGVRLGWPGVSCEMWGFHGAQGGEGYGWGAVLPAHIIRQLVGVRESARPGQLWLAPNLPAALLVPGRRYALLGLRHGADWLDLEYECLAGDQIRISGAWRRGTRVEALAGADGRPAAAANLGSKFTFTAANHSRWRASLSPRSTS